MDNITNLVSQATSAIDEFEKYMFTNHLEKYITTKEFVGSMKSKVSSVESMLRINAITEENLNDKEALLNSIISKMESITTSFKNGNNIELVVNDEGEYVAQEVSESANLTSFTDYQPIATSAVKITDYEPDKEETQEIVTPVSVVDEGNLEVTPQVMDEPNAFSQVPVSEEPLVMDDTNGTEEVQTQGENFNDALDIQAIDDFLNQNLQETTNEQQLAL